MIYSLWINNRVLYYERAYRRIQNILSEVGGVAESIMAIAIIINNFINKYIILYDTEKLLTENKILITEICPIRKKIRITKTYNNNNFDSSSFKETEERNSITPQTKEEIMKKNNKDLNKKSSLENSFYNDGKEYKHGDSRIVDKDIKKQTQSSCKNSNKKEEKFSFCNFFIYKFSFGKRYRNIRLYERFRETVISVVNLTKSGISISFSF